MARDGSGTYTRVSNSFSNPNAGTPISPTDADALFDDIETEMTDSLSRSGKGGMSADLDMNNNDINEVKTVVFQGSTSGTATLLANAISGTTTMTLPAGTDILAGISATQTLTNKSISGSSNTITNVPLSGLAAQAAYTIVANNSGSSAVPTAVDIAALTTKATPAGSDYVLLSDQAASGAFKKATVTSLGGGVTSLNGATGALVNYYAPQGRITLTSATPVMATSVSGATTVYYTPYAGNIVPIYDGTNMVPTVVAEVSQATTDSTKSPAAVAATKIYDLFVWNDSGTIRCTRGPAWTNATTRGYTLTMVSGILLNTSTITNGPAASRGTWVGTIASNASSTIDFIFGTSGAGGVAGVFNVWNAYNRVNVACTVVDLSANYTYTSATWRQANASTAMQVSFVVGASEDAAMCHYGNVCQSAAVASATFRIGIGYDSITVPANNSASSGVAANVLLITPFISYIVHNPAIGTHYFSAMENADGTNAATFNRGGAVSTAGLDVMLRM